MSRETIEEKALRYLGERRITVRVCAGKVIEADARGERDYRTGRDEKGRWHCSCPSRRRCCHRAALELLVA